MDWGSVSRRWIGPPFDRAGCNGGRLIISRSVDAAISNDTDLVAPSRTVTAERSTLVCIVCPGCGPVLRPGDRAFAFRGPVR